LGVEDESSIATSVVQEELNRAGKGESLCPCSQVETLADSTWGEEDLSGAVVNPRRVLQRDGGEGEAGRHCGSDSVRSCENF